MIAQEIKREWTAKEVCDLAEKWLLAAELAWRLYSMARRLPFPILIFSGYRTAESQAAQPDGIADHLSTHRTCPATGADVRPGIAVTEAVQILMGEAAWAAGIRWGGGAPVDSRGIPVRNEWMHFDLGPRRN